MRLPDMTAMMPTANASTKQGYICHMKIYINCMVASTTDFSDAVAEVV
jgi:hypothetical protein